MKSDLIFFENPRTSAKGTLRGAVAVAVILAANYIIWSTYTKVIDFSIIWIPIICILIASAISVQRPDSIASAAVYGALVGLTIYGVLALFLLMVKGADWNIADAFITVSIGITSSALAAVLLQAVPFLRY